MEQTQNSAHSKPADSKRWALCSLALSMLLSSMGVSTPNVALPALAQEFAASFPEVQWIVLVYLLAITVMIVSTGNLGDILGRRKILLIGIFLFTIAAALCALAPTLWMLIAARAIQGLGAAIMMSLTVAFVSDTISKEKIGSAMGLMGTMSAIGTASGPSIGGLLIAGFGWRTIFLAMVLLGTLSFYLAHRFLPARKQETKTTRREFDILGTGLLGITLATYALSVTLGGGHFSVINGALLATAIVTGGLFVFVEKKASSPVIRLTVFRDPNLSSNLVMNLIVATVMMSTLVVGPFYLARALRLDAVLVGLVMSVGPFMSTLTGIPAGRIVDRLGSQSVTIIGLAEMAIGAFALSVLPSWYGMIGYIISVAILSPGYQLFQAANNTSVMANVALEERGVISGLLSLSRNLGLITGASVMGAVFAFSTGTKQILTASPNSVAAGMQVTFWVAAVLIAMALIIALGMKIKTKENKDGK